MIWFFERESDRLHCEIRHRTDGGKHELVVTYPDGSQFIERFADAAGLIERSGSLRSELYERGWRAIGDPVRRLSGGSLDGDAFSAGDRAGTPPCPSACSFPPAAPRRNSSA